MLRRSRLGNVPLVVLVWVACGPIPLRAQHYRAQGEIVYSVGKEHAIVFTRVFELAVSNCAWSIRIDVTQATDPTPVKRFEVVHDGQSTFYYKFLGIPNGSPVVNAGVAEIDSASIPYEDASFANYVWLGLASACVFTQSGPMEIQAPWTAKDAKPRKLLAEVQLGESPLHLLDSIVYNDLSGSRRPPFDKGWKAAVMRVITRTNIGDLAFPKVFEFERFKPRQGAATRDGLDSQYKVMVLVTAFVLSPDTEIIPPKNDGVTLVHDRRLAITGGISGITYVATNGSLPRTPEAHALKELSKMSQIKRASQSGSKSTTVAKRVVLTLLMISVGIGMLIVVRQIKPKNHKQRDSL